jgi:hypothetical protein
MMLRNRLAKTLGTNSKVYERDASGNVMATYDALRSDAPKLRETHLYGSSRLGIMQPHTEPNAINTAGSGYGYC